MYAAIFLASILLMITVGCATSSAGPDPQTNNDPQPTSERLPTVSETPDSPSSASPAPDSAASAEVTVEASGPGDMSETPAPAVATGEAVPFQLKPETNVIDPDGSVAAKYPNLDTVRRLPADSVVTLVAPNGVVPAQVTFFEGDITGGLPGTVVNETITVTLRTGQTVIIPPEIELFTVNAQGKNSTAYNVTADQVLHPDKYAAEVNIPEACTVPQEKGEFTLDPNHNKDIPVQRYLGGPGSFNDGVFGGGGDTRRVTSDGAEVLGSGFPLDSITFRVEGGSNLKANQVLAHVQNGGNIEAIVLPNGHETILCGTGPYNFDPNPDDRNSSDLIPLNKSGLEWDKNYGIGPFAENRDGAS